MRGTSQRVAFALLGLPTCVAPLDAPPAFESEHFLCGRGHLPEFEARLEECRQTRLRDGLCSGYLSIQGEVDSQATVVDAPVLMAAYVDDAPDANGIVWRTQFVSGLAPYFSLLLRVNLVVDPGTGQLSILNDVAHPDFLNLEARGGNYDALILSEAREIQFQTSDELRVALSGQLSRGGSVDGCFHTFHELPK